MTAPWRSTDLAQAKTGSASLRSFPGSSLSLLKISLAARPSRVASPSSSDSAHFPWDRRHLAGILRHWAEGPAFVQATKTVGETPFERDAEASP